MHFNFDNTLLKAEPGTEVYILLHDNDCGSMLYIPARLSEFNCRTVNYDWGDLYGEKDYYTLVFNHDFKKKYKKDVLKVKWSYWEPDYSVWNKKRYKEYADEVRHQVTEDTFYLSLADISCTMPGTWDHCFITTSRKKMTEYLTKNKVIEKYIKFNENAKYQAGLKYDIAIEEGKKYAKDFGITV